jgi:cystathionine beta-lyase/cystathionine gamma-synthase
MKAAMDEFGALIHPFTSTSYGYLDTDDRLYPRHFNIPQRRSLQVGLLKMRDRPDLSSGMAAVSTTLLSLCQGDHCIFRMACTGTCILGNRELKRFN